MKSTTQRKAKARPRRPATVAEYIKAAPREARARLRQMHASVRSAAPGATEAIKWRMPAHSYRRILVMYAAFKKHISLFPTSAVTRAFASELAGFRTGKGSIQFPLDQPLPRALIRRMVALRVRQSKVEDIKWITHERKRST